jgi:serine/threonine protein kinase
MELELHGYDSFEKIGQGGMATVWKARQISLDRPVAIKILSSSALKNNDIPHSSANTTATTVTSCSINRFRLNAFAWVYTTSCRVFFDSADLLLS